MTTVEALEKTTFSGRRFTRKQLRTVQETVEALGKLSRKELAQTLCEHLDWQTPNGANKINSCLCMLEELESVGFITLPAKRASKAPVQSGPNRELAQAGPPVNDALAAISPVRLERIVSPEQREEWKAYLQAYHYLGYKHPFGSYLGYFIVSVPLGQKVGCILFSASAAWALAARDQWIGWEKKHRRKLLHLILSNDRFLIFPWVNVANLASHALSLATKQIGGDWLQQYGYRPVLIETFVDTTKYSGTCYLAANWQFLGKTKGRGCFDPEHECKETIKDIFVYPLESDWQQTLTGCHRSSALNKKYRNDLKASRTRLVDDSFVALWEKVVRIVSDVAAEFDERWQIRRRVIDSMLLILLIFRLVCAKNSQSYGTTIDELWDSCDRLNLPLPQKGSIAPSSFCAARNKLDENVFKSINRRIIGEYAQDGREASYTWLGHRVFAVDGSKINLPRALLACGYKPPSDNAGYPQGLVSCLYQLKSQMPFDFDLAAHGNERTCALNHLLSLHKDDVVVYDRGYFSYLLLHRHLAGGIHAVFRLQENSYTSIRDFFTSTQTDAVVTIFPSVKSQQEIKTGHPDLDIVPVQMRLLKYQIDGTLYCLGTTLVDQSRYNNITEFSNLYHARWGVEELYKISKRILIVEDFHAKTERGVKQELFAHFALITMNRIFANHADADHNRTLTSLSPLPGEPGVTPGVESGIIKTNFKNCIHVFARSIEELLLLGTKIKSVVNRAFILILGRYQKDRPGRSYPRKSMRPTTKWRPTKNSDTKQKLPTLPATLTA